MYRSTIIQSRESEFPRLPATGARAVAYLLIGIFLLLSGCELLSSEDDEISLEKGTFKLQTEGHINQSFAGAAVFETINSPVVKYFFLELRYSGYLENPDEKPDFLLFEGGELRPATGTYSLVESVENTSTEFYAFYYTDTVSKSFESTEGTLTVTKSNEEVMQGSFEFTASNDDDEVEVTGTFYAKKGEVLNVDIF